MTIDKAIEILSDSSTIKVLAPSPDFEDAIKLGIEALKRVKRTRDKRFPILGEELPRETVK